MNILIKGITNFYNPNDAALTAWEFNQLTKPDDETEDNFGELPEYEYNNAVINFLNSVAGRIDSNGNIQ